MRKFNFNIKDRKILYIILCIAIGSVFTLTIAYAALNAVLNISGNAEVAASNWDVHFSNVLSSDLENPPIIESPTSIVFNPVLNMPGDKYFFTVDIVNDGSIDAMIESINMRGNLTEEQTRFFNYSLTYANGEQIMKRQVIDAGEFVRLKISVEYNKNINPEDLPTSQNVISFQVTFNYSQSDNDVTHVTNNGVNISNGIISDDTLIGDEICLNDECFYYISSEESDDGNYIDTILFAKYNLFVGNKVTYYDSNFSKTNNASVFSPLEYSVVKQDSRASGLNAMELEDGTTEYYTPFYGTIAFASNSYWTKDTTAEEFLNGSDNLLAPYLSQYKNYLSSLGHNVLDVTLPSVEYLQQFIGTNNDLNYEFLKTTSYWILMATNKDIISTVVKGYGIGLAYYTNSYAFGIRPIIVYRYYK